MSLGSFIKKQFIDVLQWNEDVDGVLAWRYPMQDFEIQYGGSLTVRESQVAVFVNEGQDRRRLCARDVQTHHADAAGPHLFEELGQAVPISFQIGCLLLQHPASDRAQMGTPQAITLRDADFGMVRTRAFGMYSYAVADARKFFVGISGTRAVYTRDDLEEQLRGILVSTMANSLGTSTVPFLDMAANQSLMAAQVKGAIEVAFANYGLHLDLFNVTSINLPEDLQEALDKRIAMGMAGDLNKYTQFQVANAVPLAAQNEGGMAGVGASLSAGRCTGPGDGGRIGGCRETGSTRACGHRGCRRPRGPSRTVERAAGQGADLVRRLRIGQGGHSQETDRLTPHPMQQATCPGCGAPVQFKSAASVMAVCEYCKTTLLKDAASVVDLGKMSDVLEDYSPLQIGTAGRFRRTILRADRAHPIEIFRRLLERVVHAVRRWWQWVALGRIGAVHRHLRQTDAGGSAPLPETDSRTCVDDRRSTLQRHRTSVRRDAWRARENCRSRWPRDGKRESPISVRATLF